MYAFLIREEVYWNWISDHMPYLENHSVKRNIFTWKKKKNFNLHNFNSIFLHIQMQKIFEENCIIVFLILKLVGIIFYFAVGHRTSHRAFKSLLKCM